MSFAQHALAQSFHLDNSIFQHGIPKPGHGRFCLFCYLIRKWETLWTKPPFRWRFLGSFVICLTPPTPKLNVNQRQSISFITVHAHTHLKELNTTEI